MSRSSPLTWADLLARLIAAIANFECARGGYWEGRLDVMSRMKQLGFMISQEGAAPRRPVINWPRHIVFCFRCMVDDRPVCGEFIAYMFPAWRSRPLLNFFLHFSYNASHAHAIASTGKDQSKDCLISHAMQVVTDQETSLTHHETRLLKSLHHFTSKDLHLR